MREARVDELEVREVADGRRLERMVPRVVALQVRAEREVSECALILVEDRTHFAHIREAVVIFCA